MDNNEAVVADAEYNVLNHSTSNGGKSSTNTDALRAAYGSPTSSYYSAEEQPLLKAPGRDRSRSPQSVRKEQRWSGDKDYAHLPWWKTPSVSL